MGKVCLKHILGLLWKIVENMFFLDIEHVGMERMPPPPTPHPPPKKKLFLLSGGGKQFKCGDPPILPPISQKNIPDFTPPVTRKIRRGCLFQSANQMPPVFQ